MTSTAPSPSPTPDPAPEPRPARLRPLPLGALRPAGWLRDELQRMADSATGHLDEYWPSVRDSAWIGRGGDGWERAPYWLDGLVPLAHLLDDARLHAKAGRWIDAILDGQQEDGRLRPDTGEEFDPWPSMIVLKVLAQHREATGDPRAVPAAVRLVHRIGALLERHPLTEWARSRWAELALGAHDLHRLTGDRRLLAVAARARRQGYDWAADARALPHPGKTDQAVLDGFRAAAGGVWMNDAMMSSHGVNVAMGLKALPVSWLLGDDAAQPAELDRFLALLDAHHGAASGLFTCDEHLAGRHPGQGTETCTVVEEMFSLETALEAWGLREELADRLELLALNALPAPVSPDGWTHQYDQQANQTACTVTENPIWTNNGPDANTFGTEPNFGCCTANRHQGWPKFAARLWLAGGGEDGDVLTALSYAPCSLATDALRVTVSGGYPFADRVEITAEGTGLLRLRIPGWAAEPALTVDGADVPVAPGTAAEVRIGGGPVRIVLDLPAEIAELPRPNGALALRRGPLVFALAPEEEWSTAGAVREVRAASPWNYALVRGSWTVESGVGDGGRALGRDGAPVRIRATARRVPGWRPDRGTAAAPPSSPVTTAEPAEEVTLLPYGAVRLRVTELPWTR